MPKTFKLQPLHGISVSSARPGEQVSVSIAGFFSCTEGEAFYKTVESIGSLLWEGVTLAPSCVDHFVLQIQANGDAQLHVNELQITQECQMLTAKKAGEEVMFKDIGDITSVNLGIDIPRNSGIAILFSSGWRKGFFYDFSPLQPDARDREYDLSSVLASYFCAIGFQSRFSLTNDDWTFLLEQGWFPFAGISLPILDLMVTYVRERWPLAGILDQLVGEAKRVAGELPGSLQNSRLFKDHHAPVAAAAKHFLAGDYLSAAYLVFPQIEGLLRSTYLEAGARVKPTHASLINTGILTAMSGRHRFTLLQLEQFEKYAKDVTFAGFDWQNPAGVSRHTVGHGVVKPHEVDQASVSIAFLTLHHLMFSLYPFGA